MGHILVRALCSVALLIASGCATLPSGSDIPKPPSHAIDPTVDGFLRRTLEPPAEAHAGATGLRMLSAGMDGLTARVEMIDAAEHSVDLQYYIFRADDSGNLVTQALLRAADRGVRIRLLVDDGETARGDEKILSLAAHAGIEVRIFNPLKYRGHVNAIRGMEILLYKRRLDYRMHNKLMVADNAAAIIGGRNVGDQYFQIDPQSQFGDDDVVVAGPMVQELSSVFDEFWNSRLAVPAKVADERHTSDRALHEYLADLARYRQALVAIAQRSSTPVKTPFADILSGRAPLIWAHARVVYDSPDKKAVERGSAGGSLIYKPVQERARTVSAELAMVTPYFVPAPEEMAILKNDRDRKIPVRILTNSLESAPDLAAHAGYMHYRVELLREGVELHEVKALLGNTRGSGQSKAISRFGNYALHGKLYAFDRGAVFIGSMNFDQRSRWLNTEIGLLIDSPELSKQVGARFDALTQLDNAYTVTLRDGSNGKHPALVWTTKEKGTVVRFETEPARNGWQRFRVKLLSLLPLDKEL